MNHEFSSPDRHHPRGEHGQQRRRGPRRPGFDSGFSGGPDFGPELFGRPGRGRGGRGGPRPGARARRGDVRAAILSLLAEAPASGYALITGIEERSGGRWRPSPGSVYPTLQQLVDEHLIVGSSADGRTTEYSLTEAGTNYLEEHAVEISRAWETRRGDHDESAEILAFRESAERLRRALGQFAHEASPEQLDLITARLDALRRELYGTLAE